MLRFDIARPELDAWILFLQSHDAITKCREGAFQEVGLSPAQYIVLLALKHQPDPVRPSDVARFAFRSTNTITYLIDGLESAGLVQRVRDQADRRSIHLLLTSKGEAVYEQVRQPAWELIETMMSCFSEEELATFIRLLEKLRAQALSQLGLDDNRLVD